MLIFQDSLREIASILDNNKVFWFLEGGGCLGFERCGGFLSHDHDIDIGIYCSNEQAEKLITELPIFKTFYFNDRLTFASIHLDCYIDLFFFFEYKNYIAETIHSLFFNKVRLLVYNPIIINEGVKRVTFEGIEVNILINSKDYCKSLYGQDYLIPNENWSGWEDPKNIFYEDNIVKGFTEKFTSLTSINKNDAIEYALKRIAEVLKNCSSDNYTLGMNEGVAGLSYFFFKYYAFSGDAIYYNVASVFLDRLFKLINKELDINFNNGFCGIGWVIEYLLQNNFIEGDAEEMMEDVDNFILDKIGDSQVLINYSVGDLSEMTTYFFIKLKNINFTNAKKKDLIITTIQLFQNVIEYKLSSTKEINSRNDLFNLTKSVSFLSNLEISKNELLISDNLKNLIHERISLLYETITLNEISNYEEYYFSLEILFVSWNFWSMTCLDLIPKCLDKVENLIKLRQTISTDKYILNPSSRVRIYHILNTILSKSIRPSPIINNEKVYWFDDMIHIPCQDTNIDNPFITYLGYKQFSLNDGLLGLGLSLLEMV